MITGPSITKGCLVSYYEESVTYQYRPGVYVATSDPYMREGATGIYYEHVDIFIPGKGILSPQADNLWVISECLRKVQ